METDPKSKPAPTVTKPVRSLEERYAELLALREKVREAESAHSEQRE